MMMERRLYYLCTLLTVLISSSCSSEPDTIELIENEGSGKEVTFIGEFNPIGGNNSIAVLIYNYSPFEVEVLTLINEHRISKGLVRLELNDHISYISEDHDNYMIKNNVLNHDDFNARADLIVKELGASKVGENIAYNYLSAQAVVRAWLESPGHKKNLEGDYTHFGLSIKQHPVTGKSYFTNIFAKI